MGNDSFLFGAVTLTTVNPVSFSHHGVDGLPTMVRGVDQEGRHLKTVYIPGAQFRGRLRHEAAMAELLRGDKVKLETAYMAALGQDLRPEEDQEVEQIRLAEQLALRQGQPLLDLFGTWKMASRLMVSHLLPEQNVAADSFSLIRRDLDSNTEMMTLLDDAEQDRFYERRDKQALASRSGALMKIAMRELVAARRAKDTNKVDELEAKLVELKELKKTHKGDDESENTKHLLEVEAIPAGLTLTGKLVVQRARPRDLSILSDALDRISRKPVLGAHLARGCGEVAGRVAFTNADGEVLLVATFGGYRPAVIEWTETGRAWTAQEVAGAAGA